MSDIESTPETQNAFEAPKADLSTPVTENPILEMKRFTAWGVFGLTIITFGLYYLYWLYTRMNKINSLSVVAKANLTALYAYIVISVLNNIGSFAIDETQTALFMIIGLLGIIGFVALLIAIFSTRKALSEIINKGSQEEVKLGGILTFFFSVIYFQYKINEAIDNQSE
ncbi:DUF4234 domain-containing protein [Pseudocolwellia sp. HL-MZ7]|uniref:DUF4234 domain-containing protein n=1 Tax=Pseudocolwellia sp. HL-MZ7 TaxID=3400627 RepID=UPI003CF27883